MAVKPAELVADLQLQIADEFRELGTTPSQLSHENFQIYRSALAKITDHSSVFKGMLNNISTAYETEISALHQSRVQSRFEKDSKQELAHAEETVETLKARESQLKDTLTSLQKENGELTISIESMKTVVADISAQSLIPEEDPFAHTLLDHLTLEQMTNANLLSRELGKLQHQHDHMLEAQSAEFVPRERFEETRTALLHKEERKDALELELSELHRANPALIQLLEVVKKSKGREFEEVMESARTAVSSANATRAQVLEVHDEEDPAKEREAEVALAYMEHLEELLRDGNYNSAALHAANSPKGFLRTMSTIEDFKAMSEGEGGVSPLFVYCCVLMDTVSQHAPPPAEQSLECVQAALKEHRLDLIARWIANKHLTLSRAMADLLLCNCDCRGRCDCESGTLALAVFRSTADHDMTIHCLARQGALYRAVHYAKSHKMDQSKLLILLRALPSIDLAALLVLEENVNIGEVLTCLLEAHNDSIFIGLLKVLDESDDLKEVLLQDQSPDTVKWNDFVDVCIELGEKDVGGEIQGFIVSSQAINTAVETLNPV